MGSQPMPPLATTGRSGWTQRLERLVRVTAAVPAHDSLYVALLLAAETLLSLWIITHVSYTEIDWRAYMQEVRTWYDDGQYDYRLIRGDTGPLVYPAGFLYLFQALRSLTHDGRDVRTAQALFLVFYVATQAVVLNIYQHVITDIRQQWQRYDDEPAEQPQQTKQQPHLAPDDVPSYAYSIWAWRIVMVAMCLSKRLHSIYLLRLFNDGPTMLLLYTAVLLFMRQRWNWGCLVFSLAVSLKMNVLLFAPGLLLLLLQTGPTLATVVNRLALCCALPQLVLGAPFLLRHPFSYLHKAFELDRVFFYEWTVNWKLLSEATFLSSAWALALVAGHLGALACMAIVWMRRTRRELTNGRALFLPPQQPLSPLYIAHTLFVSNFIGIAFARTLHYQFYSWYFHAIPLLLWAPSLTQPPSWKSGLFVLVPVMLEMAFLTFPATPASSALLQAAHVVVLLRIRPLPAVDTTAVHQKAH